ncbi:type I secretion system permease/ATPase [Neotabrizicola sp. VNH66]|uniref:type I secretion system permease/ATPase n=1 Tax=Neotabrizicola sp. VNH66 TaxID=3400918 RepID=UPI003BFBD842
MPSPVRPVLTALRGQIIAVGLLSAIVNLLMLNGSFYMLQVYDRVMASRSLATLAAVTVLLLFLFGVQAGADILRQKLLALTAREFSARLRGPAHRAGLRQAATGQHGHPLQDLEQVRLFLSGSGPGAILDLPWVAAFMALAMVIHPVIGLATLAGAVMLVGLSVLAERLTRRAAAESGKMLARQRFLTEAERPQAATALAMGIGPALTARHDRLAAGAAAAAEAAGSRNAGFAAVARVLRMAIQSLMLGLGALLVLRGDLTAGAMIATSILTGRALAPIDGALLHWRPAAEARAALRRLDQALAAQDEAGLALPLPRDSLSVSALAVGAGGAPLLRGIGFALKAGDVLAIVGASGVGKSSLLRVLAGVDAPLAGEIRLDGTRMDQFAPDRLGGSVGYVAQVPGMFEGTVAENIARMAETPDPQQVLRAAEAAGVHGMIQHLPQGYDTPAGDATRPLSGGQRQRIALARALYGSPFLILLDEANAHLDAEGDAGFSRAVTAAAATGAIVIIATHRMATLSLASHVLALADGGQTAFGPRAEVMRPRTELPADPAHPLRASA